MRLQRCRILSAGLLVLLGAVRTGAAEPAAAVRVPVIVELFTSEGCSSCPPADELLARLEEEQPVEGAEVIGLSEHVDYWNRLGWADPYSAAVFTARQRDYVEAFGLDGAYTPQMVVGGQVQFTGSRSREALGAVARAARQRQGKVGLQWLPGEAGSRLRIEVENLPAANPGDTAEIVLALSESRLRSSVDRGENAGRELRHSGVVRDLRHLGTAAEGGFRAEVSLSLAPGWRREHLRAVVFVQESGSRRIVAAAALPLLVPPPNPPPRSTPESPVHRTAAGVNDLAQRVEDPPRIPRMKVRES